jgi:hypothetical protein
VLLAEYGKLKEEQVARIGFRDNLIYAGLIASAAVASATVARGAAYLLLLPPVSVLLGWTYLVNDEKVTAIGRYLRLELGPDLAGLAGRAVFGWEQPGTDARRAGRKRLQLGADLLAFCLLPAAGLVAYWATGPWPVPLLVVSAAETVLLAMLASQIVSYADLSGLRGAA